MTLRRRHGAAATRFAGEHAASPLQRGAEFSSRTKISRRGRQPCAPLQRVGHGVTGIDGDGRHQLANIRAGLDAAGHRMPKAKAEGRRTAAPWGQRIYLGAHRGGTRVRQTRTQERASCPPVKPVALEAITGPSRRSSSHQVCDKCKVVLPARSLKFGLLWSGTGRLAADHHATCPFISASRRSCKTDSKVASSRSRRRNTMRSRRRRSRRFEVRGTRRAGVYLTADPDQGAGNDHARAGSTYGRGESTCKLREPHDNPLRQVHARPNTTPLDSRPCGLLHASGVAACTSRSPVDIAALKKAGLDRICGRPSSDKYPP